VHADAQLRDKAGVCHSDIMVNIDVTITTETIDMGVALLNDAVLDPALFDYSMGWNTPTAGAKTLCTGLM
jgi:hypothetical protein